MLRLEGNRLHVETHTLTAILDRGVLVSLIRKSDGRQLIKADADTTIPLQLIYSGREIVPLGGEPGDQVRCFPVNDHHAEFRVESWNGDAVLSVAEDSETGDLILEPSGYASRPGLRACRWMMTGIGEGLELIAPFFQGVRLSLEDPVIRN